MCDFHVTVKFAIMMVKTFKLSLKPNISSDARECYCDKRTRDAHASDAQPFFNRRDEGKGKAHSHCPRHTRGTNE